MRKKATIFILLLAMSSMLVFTAGPATAAPAADYDVPVTSTDDAFEGTFTLDRVARQQGQLVAIGTLSGTLDGVGTITDQAVTMPLQIEQATCDILELTLGPLDLDILGLVVQLDVVHLDIFAEQGPGNLLGNLLCAITGLLDGNGPLGGLRALLQRVFVILGGLLG